jgi:hypothetical protein
MARDGERERLPERGPEFEELLERYASLKARLIAFVEERFASEIEDMVEERQVLGRELDRDEHDMLVDDVAHTALDASGRKAIDLFVESEGLGGEDRGIVLGWRDHIVGCLEIDRARWPLFECTNLVDGLGYALVSNVGGQVSGHPFRQGTFVMTRLVPVRNAWMMSGVQSLYGPRDRWVAWGVAADIARNNPELFFRNTENLGLARQILEKQRDRFLARFGAPWVCGSPREVERRFQEFLHLDMGMRAENVEEARLPPDLWRARSVGMVCDAIEGIWFLDEFALFLEVLERPRRARRGRHKRVVLGYLHGEGTSPAIFGLVSGVAGGALDEVLAEALGRPGFSWVRDGVRHLEEHNPGFLERPRLPGTLPLHENHLRGLEELERRQAEQELSLMVDALAEEHAGAKVPRAPRRSRADVRERRQRARKARKRNR